MILACISAFFSFKSYKCSTFGSGICTVLSLAGRYELYFLFSLWKKTRDDVLYVNSLYEVFNWLYYLVIFYEDSGCVPKS